MYDVIIIGAGPAGVSAAVYAKRGALNVLVIAKDTGTVEKAKKIENEADTLEKNIKIFKRKLKIIVEQQMAVVEEIETLDLEDN